MHILTGNDDLPHQECTCDSHTGSAHAHWECGCASPGMHILTGNGDVPHREWECDSPRMHILTGNSYPHRECTKCIQGAVAHTENHSSKVRSETMDMSREFPLIGQSHKQNLYRLTRKFLPPTTGIVVSSSTASC